MSPCRPPAVPAPALLASVLLLLGTGAVAAPLRTLWVDHDSKGGHCSDSYSAADNAAANGSKPWCTLGAAGKSVQAGDLVTVRGGTYSEPMSCVGTPGCAGMCVLEMVKKGTAANPITYRAYAGEVPIIDPAGQVPKSGQPMGLVNGVCAGITTPMGLCKAG